MKTKYHTVGTFPKPNRKRVERSNIDTSNTQKHDRSLSRIGTGTSNKSGRVKLACKWPKPSLLDNYPDY